MFLMLKAILSSHHRDDVIPLLHIIRVVSFRRYPKADCAPAEQRLVDEATQTFRRFLESPGLASWYVAQGKNIKAVFIVSKFVRLAGVAGGKGVLLAQDFAAAGRILRSMA